MPAVRVCEINCHRLDMSTRFPFQYGIASMTELPHLIMLATIEYNGKRVRGVSADGLPPKWFTKNPNTTFEDDDLPSMCKVIRESKRRASDIGSCPTFFDWWNAFYQSMQQWGTEKSLQPLLTGLGTSLVERAVLDAVCRAHEQPIFTLLKSGGLPIDLRTLRPELEGLKLGDVLPTTPRTKVSVRHTIGLGDPLTRADCGTFDPQDGLPYTLEEQLDRSQPTHFKIKLSGVPARDESRLLAVSQLLRKSCVSRAKITVDGNENFKTMGEFRIAWDQLLSHNELREFLGNALLFVEQPIHRDFALDDGVASELQNWPQAPPIIIDESDADLSNLTRALQLGYSGTSHKNCKGVVKGLLGAATIRSRSNDAAPLILSAEDLANVGPVALMQDLAMVACLGISHVERNGHHYFAGLSMFPDSIQEQVLFDHPDLYDRENTNFATLSIRQGELDLKSVNDAPFGVPTLPDLSELAVWDL